MKYIYIISLLLIAFACSEQEEKAPKKEKVENLIEIKDGIYKEFYPGKKHIKITGPVGDNNAREGKWVFLAENGEEMSICFYENGKREGHSIVKYPTGAIHYVGEYHNDKMIGIWEFFDEKGKLATTKDYGQPAE